MRFTHFSEKHNTLYILSDQILPNTKGMGWKDHCKAYQEAFKMPYHERIERWACEEAKREIKQEMKAHKGCKLSEYCNA